MTENGQIRGPVRYIYELVAHLDTTRFDIILIAGAWQKNIYESLEKQVTVLYFDINQSKISRGLFFAFRMPWILRRYGIEVYHIPDTNPLPVVRCGAAVVSTIHDMAEYVVPYRFTRFQAFCRRIISRIQGHYSSVVITVSEASRSEIVKYLHMSPSSVEAIYPGTSGFKTPAAGRDMKDPDREQYILYVGVLENAKNVDRLVEAFGRLPHQSRRSTHLYLVGRKGNAYSRIVELIIDLNLTSNVKLFGYVDDRELEELYRGAFVFAYVSEYEGFGLPIIEAMQYGLPVLTSNRSCLPEVAGSAALTVESDVPDIMIGLERLLSDENLRRNLSDQGPRRAAEFSWAETARKTGDVYLRAAKSSYSTFRPRDHHQEH